MPRATAPPTALLGGPVVAMRTQQPPQPVHGGPGELGIFLAAHALEQYEDAFVAAGYHRLVLLQGMDEDEENELIAVHKMPRPHARALRAALWQLRAAAPERQAANSSDLDQVAPLLATAEPIVVHAVEVHGEPHGWGVRSNQRARKHRRDRCSCRQSGCTSRARRVSQAMLLLFAVAIGLAFVYMDICGDSWSDTGKAPSWCWPHPSSLICDDLNSPTGSKQWTRKQAAGLRCGSYCCGAAHGSQCGHFTLHAPMTAMQLDIRVDGTVDASVSFFGGGSVSCLASLEGQSWKYDTSTGLVDVESTCLAKYWRAERLDPPTMTYSIPGDFLSVDFSSKTGRAGYPSGHGIYLRLCPHSNHTSEALDTNNKLKQARP